MPEGSYVRKLMSQPSKDAKEEIQTEWRQAFTIEREGSGQPFSVAVRLKDGRDSDGFPGSLYLRHKWLDRGHKLERLVWLFSCGGIYIEGQHLKRGLDALEEGKLKRIQEQDSSEIALIESHNADIRKREDKEPVVTRVIVSPGFEAFVESDENFIEIAKAIRGEYAGNAGRDNGSGR